MRTLALLAAVVLAGCGGNSEATGWTPMSGALGGGTGGAGGSSGSGAAPDAGLDAEPDVEPVAGCGDGKLDPGEACDDGNDSPFDGCKPDCTVVEPLTPPDGQWTYFEIEGTRCLDGKPAGFGVSTSKSSDGLMIYLEGGGACFNDACDLTAFNIPFVPPIDGIFNRVNPNNPVRDWNMVYVPYCTGDIHGGDAETTVAGQLRQFRGFTNITRYLETWVPSFASVDRVLVTGISAGGFGAGLNAQQIAEAFGPSRELYMIDDSGPPLSKAAMPPCLQQTFRAMWGLDGTVLASCGSDCSDVDDFARGWVEHLLLKYGDNAHAAVFSNTQDTVIRTFMGFGWGNGQYDNCSGVPVAVPSAVYQADLLDLRDEIGDKVSTYYIGPMQIQAGGGIGHTVLRTPSFYTTFVGGVLVCDWVTSVLAKQVVHVGP